MSVADSSRRPVEEEEDGVEGSWWVVVFLATLVAFGFGGLFGYVGGRGEGRLEARIESCGPCKFSPEKRGAVCGDLTCTVDGWR